MSASRGDRGRSTLALMALMVCLLAALGLFAACADPEVSVTVRVPPAQRDATATVVVEVYQPAVAQPLSCDELAFGAAPAPALQLSRLRQVSLPLAGGAGPIGPIDRTATTIIVAHALSAEGAAQASGCEALAPFDDDVRLEIDLEPVVVLSLSSVTANAPLGEPLDVRIAVADLDGQPIPTAALRWVARGARHEGTSGSASVAAQDQGHLAIDPPRAAGPVVIQVRGRWANNNPARISGYVLPSRLPTTVAERGVARAYAAGRFEANDRWAVAVVVEVGGQSLLRYCAGSTPVSCTEPPIRLPGPGPVARVTTAGEDRLVLATAQNIVVYRGAQAEPAQPHGGGLPVQLLPAGACPDPSGVVVVFDDGTHQYHAAGQQQPSPLQGVSGSLLASGCVSTDTGDVRRAFVTVAAPEGASRVEVLPTGAGQASSVPWLGAPAPVAFTRSFDGWQLMLGVKTRIDELVVARGTVALGAPAVETAEHDVLPGRPHALASGDIDGDGELDIVALVEQQRIGASGSQLGVWTVLGAKAGPQRIAGVLPLMPGVLCQTSLLVADLDGDGVDEIIVGGAGTCPAGGGTPGPPARMLVLDLSPPASTSAP